MQKDVVVDVYVADSIEKTFVKDFKDTQCIGVLYEQESFFFPLDMNFQSNQEGNVANYSDAFYYNFEYNQQNFASQDFLPLTASAPPPTPPPK